MNFCENERRCGAGRIAKELAARKQPCRRGRRRSPDGANEAGRNPATITIRQPKPGLIHHTDRGGQYASSKYRKTLERAWMMQSMSRADNCYDNAFMESCFGTIKTELGMKPYENHRIARKEISDYIRYYNTRRRDSSLNYMPPDGYERAGD